MTTPSNSNNKQYTAKDIVVSKFPDCVRNTPGMYIGDPNDGGQEHLVKEIIDNSIDECLAGFATEVSVVFHKENFISVKDNGRGMPPDIVTYEDEYGNKILRSGIETIFTVLHAGAKSTSNDSAYKISGGLHGVGASVVNALSESLEVTVFRDKEYYMKFENGIVSIPLTERENNNNDKGTHVKFKPASSIFFTPLNEESILTKVEELAYLNPGVKIHFKSEITSVEKLFFFPNGLIDFINKMLDGKKKLSEPLLFQSKEDDVESEVAMLWCVEDEDEEWQAFTNTIPQPDGGHHVTGFRLGIIKSVNDYLNKNKNLDYISSFFKKHKIDIISEDIRVSMKYIIHVKLKNPLFSSQTKTKLASQFVKDKVFALVRERLGDFFEKKPEITKKIIEKVFNNAIARNISKSEREKILKKSEDIDSFSIPGKLADCDKRTPPENRELFIVEGDSAGGTTKQARDRSKQAVLSLFGKVSNAMKITTLRVLQTEALMTIVSVLGINIKTGDGDEELEDISYLEKLRYHKIIIMADADVDGSHIRALLLAFFYRYLPFLLKNGHVYLCRPPLYGVKIGGQVHYIRDDNTFKKFLSNKLHEEYTFKLKDGRELNEDEIGNLTILCEEFKKQIQSYWSGDLSLKILCLFEFLLTQEKDIIFINNEIKKINSIMTIREDVNDYIFEEKTIFGCNSYRVKKREERIGIKLKNTFPILVTSKKENKGIISEKLFNNPVDILEYLEKIINKIEIQRFKGLGEMTAKQLKITGTDVETRIIEKVEYNMKDALIAKKMVNELMTNEGSDTRKQMILNTLDKHLYDV